jgi:chaperonin cofactor prefoldin
MGSASTEARLEALEKEIKSLKKQEKAKDKKIQ